MMIGGAFANAVRVIPDTESDVFLDFCSYSESDQQGVVVARVRIHSSFIPIIRDRLSSTMTEMASGAKPPNVFSLVKGPGKGVPS
jgi:hypothetical protein